ncbi:hypothetical protein ACFMQL_40530 [Nonomuraea fastidiosa]|uniref:hypothetical protein n=1 Tax=Nonomuraea TaxID=83681 RepID=UPI00324AB6A0
MQTLDFQGRRTRTVRVSTPLSLSRGNAHRSTSQRAPAARAAGEGEQQRFERGNPVAR